MQVGFLGRASNLADTARTIPDLNCRKLGMFGEDQLPCHLNGNAIIDCLNAINGHDLVRRVQQIASEI